MQDCSNCEANCCMAQRTASHAATTVTHVYDHVCNKERVVQAIAFSIKENCTGSSHLHHLQTQKFVVDNCDAPVSTASWVMGTKVQGNCNDIPMYSPLFTFYHGSGHDSAGIFGGCDSDGNFKVIMDACGRNPRILDVTNTTSFFNHIFRIKW